MLTANERENGPQITIFLNQRNPGPDNFLDLEKKNKTTLHEPELVKLTSVSCSELSWAFFSFRKTDPPSPNWNRPFHGVILGVRLQKGHAEAGGKGTSSGVWRWINLTSRIIGEQCYESSLGRPRLALTMGGMRFFCGAFFCGLRVQVHRSQLYT